MHIFPFQPLVPSSDEAAADVTCPHYDAYSTTHLQAHLHRKPNSFMSIMRPDALLPSKVSSSHVNREEVTNLTTKLAKDSLQRLQCSRHLVRDNLPHFYIYALELPKHRGGHTQIGLIATANVSDYDDSTTILKHELTRSHKELSCTDFIDSLSANPGGPVFLTYQDVPLISTLINNIMDNTNPSLYIPSDQSEDGIGHTVFKVPQQYTNQVCSLFDQFVDTTYIADGHHRAASLSNIASRRGLSQSAKFSVALFPKSHLKLSSFTRILSGVSTSNILSHICKKLGQHSITNISNPTGNNNSTQNKGEVYMYFKKKWYAIVLPNYKPNDMNRSHDMMDLIDSDNDDSDDDSLNRDDPAGQLDTAILQRYVLEDLAHDKSTKLKFVTGNLCSEELMKKVDRLDIRDGSACAFLLRSVSVEDVMRVAEANQVMPPKSTSFEPKLRCGFFTQTF